MPTMHSPADVRRGDQRRALWLSTIAFTVCFAVWTIFSIIGVQIKKDLGLNDTQFGLLVGTPILTGSLIRLMLGIWTDQYGGRIVYTAVMLSAAVATWLLTFAYDYPTFLLAALGVGIAGGSFAVGIAYVSRWYPTEKQGTALGIFGAGNVGAAVTKFLAPFVMVAYGWQAVANIWARAIAVMGVVFWFATKDDPQLEARRKAGLKPEPVSAMLEPLKNVQVWRFSLYYFFVFGAFVALALWLPRYLIGVYGLDIATAGMIGAAYSVPASLFRVYGGHLSDTLRRAPRHVLDLRRVGRRLVHPLLSADRVHRAGHPRADVVPAGDRACRLHRAGVHPRLLHEPRQGRGLQAHPGLLPEPRGLGRRRRRPDRRPGRLRAADPVRPRQRPDRRVAELLHAAVRDLGRPRWCGCTSPSARWSARRQAWHRRSCPSCRRCSTSTSPRCTSPPSRSRDDRRAVGRGPARLAARKTPSSGAPRAAPSPGAICWISIPALLLSFAVWMVWSVVVAKLPLDRLHLLDRPAVLAGGAARPLGRHACASSTPSWSRSSAAGCGPRSPPGR